MERFCERCGAGHDCGPAEDADKAAVTIARIEADRDIRLAEIQARAGVKIAEVDAEHNGERAEGVVEGMETALDAMTGGDADDEPEGAPIVIDAGDLDAEPEPEPEPDTAPPVIDVPEPATPKPAGWWGPYR